MSAPLQTLSRAKREKNAPEGLQKRLKWLGRARRAQDQGSRSRTRGLRQDQRRQCLWQRYKHSAGNAASACNTELHVPASFSRLALSEIKQHRAQCTMGSILKVLLSRQPQSMPRKIRSQECGFGDFFVPRAKEILSNLSRATVWTGDGVEVRKDDRGQ